jgi:predicted DNA-binding protein YlxM (UPF0122 family)
MDAFEVTLLFDTYGGMLTQKQREYLDMRYNQDMSLSEIAEVQEVSRQAVFDNLSRTEGQLKKMEEKTGCVRRDRACRKAAAKIAEHAQALADHTDPLVSDLARQILAEAKELEE